MTGTSNCGVAACSLLMMTSKVALSLTQPIIGVACVSCRHAFCVIDRSSYAP